MDAREYRAWQAWEAVCGPVWSGRRADYHTAMIMAAFMNTMRSKKSRPVRPEKLVPWNPEAERRPEQSPEDMLRAVKAANKALGGREVRHRGDAAGPRDPHLDQTGRHKEGPG